MKKTKDVQPAPGVASERSESLLDLIAREAHCDYLSDLHSLYLKGQLPEEISRITKDKFGVQPVSYTHLDVYKRQALSR